MSLQFILGTASQDHLEETTNQTIEWLNQDDRHQVYMIVPNNIKFEMEFEVLNRYYRDNEKATVATTRIQNFSFSRLAWAVLKDENYKEKPSLDMAGVQMLVRGLLKKYEHDFLMFRTLTNRPNFGEQLSQTLLELINGGFTVDDLNAFYESRKDKEGVPEHHMNRLHDLCVIYPAFYEAHHRFSFDNHDLMQSLSKLIWEGKGIDYKHTKFIFYGFHHFDAYELPVIEALINKANVLVSLKGRFDANPDEEPGLFYSVQKAKQRLERIARHDGQTILPAIHLQDDVRPKERQAMDDYWQNHYGALSQRKWQKDVMKDYATVWKCDDKQTEVEMIARQIIQLVKKEGYRYKDVTIMTNDIVNDKRIIEPIFKAYHIPVNISESQKMASHPFVEWLEILLMLVQYRNNTDQIFRLLRTELLLPKNEDVTDLASWYDARKQWRQDVDLAERFNQACDYKGYEWYKRDEHGSEYEKFVDRNPNHKDKKDERGMAAINEIRPFIMRHIERFQDIFKKAKDSQLTAGEVLTQLYRYLNDSGVIQELQRWQQWDEKQGKVEEAEKHEQVWKTFVHLLDEYYMLFHDETFDFDIFKDTLLSGLLSAKYHLVPMTLDEVSVVNKIRQRGAQTPLCFFMSCTSHQLPAKTSDGGLLDDYDRKQFYDYTNEEEMKQGDSKGPMSFMFIGVEASTRLLNEAYFAYETSVFATQHVWFTYASHNQDGEAQSLSPYIKNMELTPETFHTLPSYRAYDDRYISTFDRTLSLIVSMEREAKDQFMTDYIAPEWNELSSQILYQTNDAILKRIKESLTYTNMPSRLIHNDDMIESLYSAVKKEVEKEQKHELFASITRLETFNRCPYQFFLKYGLKLKEMERYEFSYLEKGNFYHVVLEGVMKKIVKDKDDLESLASIDEKEKEQITREVMDNLINKSNYKILDTQGYMEYLAEDIQKRLERVIRVILNMASQYPHFHRSREEMELKHNFVLNDKWNMMINSKIDRFDIISEEDEDDLSFVLIDYKSGNKTFDYDDIYYGIALQLLTYVEMVKENKVSILKQEKLNTKAELDLSTLGYLPLQPAKKEVKQESDFDNEDKQYKIKGLYQDDSTVLSSYVGTIDYKKPVISKESLSELEQYNHQTLIQTGQAIVSGDIKLHPYYKKKKTACDQCPFHDICQFDALMDDNDYRYCNEKITLDRFQSKLKEEK